MFLLFLPVFLLTILYTMNISFLIKKELSSIWKKLTLFFNILALVCSIPSFYTVSVVALLGTMETDQKWNAYLLIIGAFIYFFVVNIILSILLIKKKAVKNSKIEIIDEDITGTYKNKNLKILSYIFLYVTVCILLYRSMTADGAEVFFIKGALKSEIYVYYFLLFVFTTLATVIIFSQKKRMMILSTTISFGLIFLFVMALHLIIKPTYYSTLSSDYKQVYTVLSKEYLEKFYPEGIELTGKPKYKKSDLGNSYIKVKFNYSIINCNTGQCGPYEFIASYQMKTYQLANKTDSGQVTTIQGQDLLQKNGGKISFVIKNNQKGLIIEKEAKEIFIEKEKANEVKQQLITLIEEGYGFSTNNGLPIGNGRYFDRAKFTESKKSKYEELLSVDAEHFIDYIKNEGETMDNPDTEANEIFPLGRGFGKIIFEEHADGYLLRGLPFKTVDKRQRLAFELENGETFTGILESDEDFRADRAWITVEDEGTSNYKKDDFIQLKFY
ncbi:hypothetical protein [Ureibacillus aquaedulcis]|uniref:Uncharacterized protein n=1 Tax=Ureibacillus aquaedulcis TaxID=3058421 RepID=A0ABT8GN76_9BACL|nr:hypothetical protein [Ureibacillus sp. BA0131]MDN4492736.1 hypothetical protein [Ureibacillus sp. BA0131]